MTGARATGCIPTLRSTSGLGASNFDQLIPKGLAPCVRPQPAPPVGKHLIGVNIAIGTGQEILAEVNEHRLGSRNAKRSQAAPR